MKAIYKMNANYGRNGNLYGILSFEGIEDEDEDDRTVLELINEIIKLENE